MAQQEKHEDSLYFEEYGNGDPILLIHGFGESIYSWRYLLPIISTSNRAIAIDLKGFGKSPKPMNDHYSIADHANTVRNFIIEHDLRNLTLIGHSLGGGVALITALSLLQENNPRVIRLIIIDGVAYEQPLPLFIRVLRTPFLGKVALSLLPVKWQVRSILKLAYFDDTKIPSEAVTKYALPLESRGGRYAVIRTARNIIPQNTDSLYAAYSNISIPTLLLWGREDKIVPLSVGERLHNSIKGSRLEIFDDCGHIPHEEVPDVAIPVIEEFLNTH